MGLSITPCVIGSGFDHVMTGIVLAFTVSDTAASAVAQFAMSCGVKIKERVCFPSGSKASGAGKYSNVPGTDAVAQSCVALSCSPHLIGLGAGHSMTGSILV